MRPLLFLENQLELRRVESARRTLRSALHLLSTAANTIEHKRNPEIARQVRQEIDEIQSRFENIAALIQSQLKNPDSS